MTLNMTRKWHRRDFLTAAGLLPFSLGAVPAWASTVAASGQRRPDWNRTLVLIELKGGNDGLNTVIPFADPNYYRLRPRLAVPQHQVIRLTSQLGLHPELAPLKSLWETANMGIVLGVGYPKPNLSHFRSIEIWDTASDSHKYLDEGWVARALAKSPPPKSLPADGVILGRDDAGPLFGDGLRTISLKNPKQLMKQARLFREISIPFVAVSCSGDSRPSICG